MLCAGVGAGKTLGDRQATGTFRTTLWIPPNEEVPAGDLGCGR